MRSLLTGFKQFIMRGNVIELAVAVVIGTAFTALVNGLVEGLLNPLVALVAGRNDLSQVGAFEVAGTPFRPGLAIDALITFLLVSAAVYFFIVLPLKRLAELRARDEEAAAAAPSPADPVDVVLLREIRDLLAAGAAGQAAAGARTGSAPPGAGPDGAGAGASPAGEGTDPRVTARTRSAPSTR